MPQNKLGRTKLAALVASIAVLAFAFLLLLVLAVMRELTVVHGDVKALSQLITQPPDPAFLGKSLPEDVAAAVNAKTDVPPRVLVYLSDSCGGCRQFVRRARQVLPEAARQRVVLVVAGPQGSSLVRAAEESGLPTVVDPRAQLHRSAAVLSTPTAHLLDHTGIVEQVEIGASVEWTAAQASAMPGAEVPR